jgi:acyl-CoA synthetase (AMP-forming)/AMP-acid ligase II
MPNPLFHAFGCVIGTLVALSHGVKLVMPSPLPNAMDTLKALKTEKYFFFLAFGRPNLKKKSVQVQHRVWDAYHAH